ncbi:MAG TPA: mechanosensitive ion channel family protein [Marmoricola sp.]|jgi:small conductance mechanosensitive channel|nr:mechanosensitive ion channel family protein [Marmoricola sp.]
MLAAQTLLEMPRTCTGADGDSWTCAIVYDWTGNEELAHAARWLIGKPLAILVLVLLGFLARWVLHRLIDRLVAKAQKGAFAEGQERPDVSRHRRVQRALTMAGLLKSIVTVVVLAIVVFMGISELGYNIAPLIASAGVVGVALGFGAQSLVKDYLSGIFMIFEDQFGVGDSVTVGEISGTVEGVSLRVTRIRDVDGTVWYIRNGEILSVGNQSQNWARSVLDVSVGYDEDLTRVRQILGEVARKLWREPEYRDLVLEEPEVWGVQSLSPEAVVVRVVLKTRPLEQWSVAREMRERIKDRFDAEGIRMPQTQRVLWHRDRPKAADAATPTVE